MAATLQRKYSGGIIFVVITPDYYKNNCSKEFFRNNFGQDGIAKPPPATGIQIPGTRNSLERDLNLLEKKTQQVLGLLL